ncbi:unnamed protein product [Ceutorhynchus assimilis]|uniref:Uncharacterized protein n=1 Tax=Ceutorhynchus assimilis TaxID=467358 RepID=A0A9N9QIZ3_9CUCU|nr:unnamed protein product [Ceutorhynchus assimilis]
MEEEQGKCIKCKERIEEDETIHNCDSCLRQIHTQCAKLSPSEERCMPLKKRISLYICIECKALIARMPFIMKTLDEIKLDINQIKQNQINNGGQRKTYADALELKPTANTEQTIIIKAKNKKNANNTRKLIEEKLNPSALEIGIKKVRSTKEGDVIIKCPTKLEGEKLKTAMINELADTCTIEKIKKRPTRIKITGVDKKENKNHQEVERNLRKQNTWINEEDELTVTFIKHMKKNDNLTIYVECSAGLYHKAISQKKVYAGWQQQH